MDKVKKPLDNEEFLSKLKRYSAEVRRDRRLSGTDVVTTTIHSLQLCGSRLTLDAVIEAGRVQSIGYRVRACSLGQATTAIIAERAPGMNAADLQAVQNQLEQILHGYVPSDDALIWPELAIFQHAATMPARHGSALLPFRGLQKLFEKKNALDESLQKQANDYIPTGDLRWFRMSS
ncbi:MAG TPA: hypothetical protein PKK10_16625 [Woeseiaceae bacterium]|nr:hypothetical protein [Woeseiaceae bacterium]